MTKNLTPETLKSFVRGKAVSFLTDNNITSVGVGYKITKGKQTKTLSVQFTVGQKHQLEELVKLETLGTKLIPKSFDIDGFSVPTDVIARSYDTNPLKISDLEKINRKKKMNPILPGASIGHPSISAGTAGCLVYDADNGDEYLLSNWHVLQGNQGKIGDWIVQPGRHDDSKVNQNRVGILVNSHLGLAGDCAIARINSRKFSPQIMELGNIKVEDIADPELGDTVMKSGRTTGVTHGVVSRVYVTVSLNYGAVGVKRIGGFEYVPNPKYPARNGEISMGGDSGSAVVYSKNGKATNTILGVHFAGETGDAPEHALACYASSVFKKMNILPYRPSDEKIESVRPGFDSFFLGRNVRPPYPATDFVYDSLLDIKGKHMIHYTHFSLVMNRDRKLAAWSAWNIDGERIVRVKSNSKFFKRDSRLPKDAQLGNELYRNNPLDRGHIARRAELCWGTREEAERANRESYYYTNIAPQHERFNQSKQAGIWGKLENAVFDQAKIKNLRVNVMAGPIFKSNDPKYRSIQIPRDFWKVISYIDEETNELIYHAFILSQTDLISGLESLDFDDFNIYKVSIDKVTEETGFRFDDLVTSGIEVVGEESIKKITSLNQVLAVM